MGWGWGWGWRDDDGDEEGRELEEVEEDLVGILWMEIDLKNCRSWGIRVFGIEGFGGFLRLINRTGDA